MDPFDKARAQKVWFEDTTLWVLLNTAGSFPCFNDATDEQLADCQISGGGLALH